MMQILICKGLSAHISQKLNQRTLISRDNFRLDKAETIRQLKFYGFASHVIYVQDYKSGTASAA